MNKKSNKITSDNPCFTFTNKEGFKEPIFVALPGLIISLVKKDSAAPNSYVGTVRRLGTVLGVPEPSPIVSPSLPWRREQYAGRSEDPETKEKYRKEGSC